MTVTGFLIFELGSHRRLVPKSPNSAKSPDASESLDAGERRRRFHYYLPQNTRESRIQELASSIL